MNWFNRLSGHRRTSAGLEWHLWRRLPAVLAWGSALPGLLATALWWSMPAVTSSAAERAAQTLLYALLGVLLLHWTLVLTLAIGCVVVMVMKGPAYVADAYPPPGRDPLV
jgi:hypothetical protein